MILMIVLVIIILYILSVIGMWKVFLKAKVPGILSIIPFVNIFFYCKIATGRGIWFLLSFIPFVNIVFEFYITYRLAKTFGHGVGYMFGLTFLPMIFWIILGFEDSVYQGPYVVGAKNNRSAYNTNTGYHQTTNTNNTGNTNASSGSSPKFCRNCGAPLKEGATFCSKCGTKI